MKMREAMRIAFTRCGETPEEIEERFKLADSMVVAGDSTIKEGDEEKVIQFHMKMLTLSKTGEGKRAMFEALKEALRNVDKQARNQ